MNPEMEPAVTTCGNCRSPMPKELRFCRNCGFRLGEGLAEYTETVRFQDVPPNSFPHVAGPIAVSPGGQIRKGRRRMSGMSWMFLCLLIFFVGAAAFTAIKSPNVHIRPIGEVMAPRSYFGVDGFETAENDSGATFANVEPPGSPADNAGLVGGDIITSADGQPVHSDDDMMAILRRTPIGKTIDIVYIRDGETKNTKLTTFSEEDSDRLAEEFDDRPVGQGRFGFNPRDTARVQVPGTKMFGLKMNKVSPSLPADMAGIKAGDIILEFGGVPIRTVEELTSRARRAIPYQFVDVLIFRDGQQLKIPVKMGKQ